MKQPTFLSTLHLEPTEAEKRIAETIFCIHYQTTFFMANTIVTTDTIQLAPIIWAVTDPEVARVDVIVELCRVAVVDVLVVGVVVVPVPGAGVVPTAGILLANPRRLLPWSKTV